MSSLATLALRTERIEIRNLLRFLIMLIQLGAIVVILRQFQIESRAFREVAVLAFIGFAVHYFLPQKFRLSFFAALSIASVILILGMVNAAWLLGFGLVLLGICHLPLKLWLRV